MRTDDRSTHNREPAEPETEFRPRPVSRGGHFEHEMSGTCWCQPKTTYEDPLTGERVFVHRRTMDAES